MAKEEEADEIKGKAYDSKLMKRLLAYAKPYKKYIVAGILLNILVAGLGPVRPYLTKIAINSILYIKNFITDLIIILILFKHDTKPQFNIH